ncbi:MAG TPA: glutaredoxin 3 [Xanthobacteraceae bacterium]|nr:glutaredoxin 3 [Xanthobacteraceae bacterium]
MPAIEIYTTRWCGYCRAAKALLARKGLSFTEFDVGTDAGKRDEMLARTGGRHTVPQIFIGDKHIGGSDDLHALERSGALDALLASSS